MVFVFCSGGSGDRGCIPSWALAGAQPCGARRAERLGRSGCRGPRRRRDGRCQPEFSFWVTSPPGMVGPRFPVSGRRPRNGSLRPFLDPLLRPWTRGNLFPLELLLPVKNLQVAIFLFAHPHLALRRRVMLALAFHLIKTVLMLDYPVITQHPFGFQPENLLQLLHSRTRQVIVLRRRRRLRITSVVLRAVLFPQVAIGVGVRTNLFPPQLLHQTVLMRPVISLHAPFRLGRTRRPDLDRSEEHT